MFQIESLLSARLFLVPQVVGERIYFISNLGGQLSLYAMDHGGSVPEPLLPPQIALQNPHLLSGHSFYVFPKLDAILVMIDRDGDENYQPMLLPLGGGYPQPAFEGFFAENRVHCVRCDRERDTAYLLSESRSESLYTAYRTNLASGELLELGSSTYGAFPQDVSPDRRRVLLSEGYSMGDVVLYLWEEGKTENRLLYGVPLAQRQPGEVVEPNGISAGCFTADEEGLLLVSALFDDHYSPGYLPLSGSSEIEAVGVEGSVHQGLGEMTDLQRLKDGRYAVGYNIDGCSWLYEAGFDRQRMMLKLERVICGQGILSNGVLESWLYDEAGDCFSLSFSTATSPTQIYTVEGSERKRVIQHTREKVLGIAAELLSTGEDVSLTSFDGTRISARLYLPAERLEFEYPLPLVYYVHGGPQSQERPDFSWFSMPLIQYLTLNGFAVFVPNVRGSTGYGLRYTKQVDRDWGGKDRLDHVHALKVLAEDARLDTSRTGVVGRSYGGYMSLTLAARHPQLWKAAVDMFGPYDLVTFSERIPETWKPYFRIALGDAEMDGDFLVERSPRTYIEQLTCPLLVIQGRNDPRVVEAESRDLVEHLRRQGKQVEYLVFENEGHDVLKFDNRVRCYTAIADFFNKYLKV